MLSRVAAVKAPRAHNRRRVTGSSGRRREGRESEPQKPNMSRRVFNSVTMLLLFVVMMCCGSGASHVVEGNSGDAQLPNEVAIFVPNKTQVVPKNGGEGKLKGLFASPALVRAGGVMVAFVEGRTKHKDVPIVAFEISSSDIVAGYIKAPETWQSLVAEVTKNDWKAHTVLESVNFNDRLGVAVLPTAITKGKKVFLLVGSYELKRENADSSWKEEEWKINVIEGEATQTTEIQPSQPINWSEPKPLFQTDSSNTKGELKEFFGGGGSGIVMGNGALVFPLTATNKNDKVVSLITYWTDDGQKWEIPEGVSSETCRDPRITEWEEETLLMVTYCEDGRKVFESRDMGKKWTEAVGKLPGVWLKIGPVFQKESLYVGALITATIEERKLMLYTQKVRHSLEDNEPNALYLWVTDNNRTFSVGPLSVDSAENKTFANTLLYSDGELYLSQQRGRRTGTAVSLARLTGELSTIKSVLSTWKKLDASFSESSIPTAGLVGFLSNATSDDTWIDDYRCLNASVRKAAKVENGFKFTGPGSRAVWPVNSRWDIKDYGFVNHGFTLVAMVTIHQAPSESTSLLGAVLGEVQGDTIIGLSYGADRKWETVFDGKTTPQDSKWEPGKEYQVALMLQGGNKGSVYVDGQLVRNSEDMQAPEARGGVSYFYIGGDKGDSGSSVTVKNVFLYNRPLSDDELKMIKKGEDEKEEGSGDGKKGSGDDKKGSGDGSVRGDMSRVLLLLLLLGLCGIAALY
ncbi:trans-sialidase, putative [Trypanosoma cruzi marinkellei]|uniref:Trans-sialidase, putative n=1 Tax=Trypanosoma cruzi marinkellei TaxID=85056 RepID=K2N2S8_TRYCR|nr:trans-sialidase, putative [Trypanosoma cruzi marinkellei]